LLIQQFKFCVGENVSADQMFEGINWFERLPQDEKNENSQRLEKYRIQLQSIVNKLRFNTIFQIL
jgi:hypothetical protein